MGKITQASKLSFWKELYKRIQEDGVTDLSAQLAYYFLLSLFPFLIVTITIVTAVFDGSRLVTLLEFYGPTELTNVFKENMNVINRRGGTILSIGIVVTLWTASNGMNAIIRTLNKAYDVLESRHFIVARGIAILLTLGMLLIIFVAMTLPVFGRMIGHLFFYIGSLYFEPIWDLLRWIVSSIIIAVVIMVIYLVAPNKRLYVKDVWIGATVATGWLAVYFLRFFNLRQ